MTGRWYVIVYVKDGSYFASMFGYRKYLDTTYDNDKFVYAAGDTPEDAERSAVAKAKFRRESKDLTD